MAKVVKKDPRTPDEIAAHQLHLEAERDYQTQSPLDVHKRLILLERKALGKEPAAVNNDFRHPPVLPSVPEPDETESDGK